MYDARLFLTSGHYQNYKDDMYSLDVEKQEWMLKPMNCPGHFVMFDARELPLRYADFGVLHRNEASGALTGLTRVRRFQQDDAHIFCRPDQIKSEVASALDFLDFVYKIFGFKASYALSTRPKKALGSKEIWDNAEVQLKAALDQSGREWSLNPGDGAFYGPKIDIRLQDAMKRKHQCGTIQLDFNGPIRFNLQYRKEGVEESTECDEEKGEYGCRANWGRTKKQQRDFRVRLTFVMMPLAEMTANDINLKSNLLRLVADPAILEEIVDKKRLKLNTKLNAQIGWAEPQGFREESDADSREVSRASPSQSKSSSSTLISL
eukprot:symbB.v1.2.024019.t1/scaffold2154.1/size87782/6